MAPFVELYTSIIDSISGLGVSTYTPSQEIPKKLPTCRVSILSGDPNEYVKNDRRYSYSFQIDAITPENGLEEGLVLAYKIMQALRKISVDGFSVQMNGEPSLSSMVDSSTNRILNRQIIRVNYNIIEDTIS